ncbi:unnamed protein product [Citrullus colocynthis]|uniref:Uncharacterized protein n=1 Tax=Citrullus colocynthis TaxID=252529 RepID=A0ABP0YME0_9ROSI
MGFGTKPQNEGKWIREGFVVDGCLRNSNVKGLELMWALWGTVLIYEMILTEFLVLGMRDLETGLRLSSSAGCLYELQPPPSPTTPTLVLPNSGKTLLVSNSSKSLVLSNSGKRFDKKKYVKQVTGRHKDTELHLAA